MSHAELVVVDGVAHEASALLSSPSDRRWASRMTRRQRSAPLMIDRDGDVAAVLFEQRSRRRRWMVLSLQLRDPSGWREVEQHRVDGDPRAERCAGPDDSTVVLFGTASWGTEIEWIVVQVASGFTAVELHGRRHDVPDHGWVVWVWPRAQRLRRWLRLNRPRGLVDAVVGITADGSGSTTC